MTWRQVVFGLVVLLWVATAVAAGLLYRGKTERERIHAIRRRTAVSCLIHLNYLSDQAVGRLSREMISERQVGIRIGPEDLAFREEQPTVQIQYDERGYYLGSEYNDVRTRLYSPPSTHPPPDER